jgi:menaquinone-specific isochorismate synthase
VGRSGQLWQAESFDHVVRNGEKLEKFIRYTVENPLKAGLKNWRWAWRAEL